MRDERDAASRRPPPLARRDEASRAPRGVRSLQQRTTLPCGPFLAVHPGWLHHSIVGFCYELLLGDALGVTESTGDFDGRGIQCFVFDTVADDGGDFFWRH